MRKTFSHAETTAAHTPLEWKEQTLNDVIYETTPRLCSVLCARKRDWAKKENEKKNKSTSIFKASDSLEMVIPVSKHWLRFDAVGGFVVFNAVAVVVIVVVYAAVSLML